MAGEGSASAQGRWGEKLGAPKMRLLCALLRAGFEPLPGIVNASRPSIGPSAEQRISALAANKGDGASTERLKTGANESRRSATQSARRVFRPHTPTTAPRLSHRPR